jgi:hypothetical protein
VGASITCFVLIKCGNDERDKAGDGEEKWIYTFQR